MVQKHLICVHNLKFYRTYLVQAGLRSNVQVTHERFDLDPAPIEARH